MGINKNREEMMAENSLTTIGSYQSRHSRSKKANPNLNKLIQTRHIRRVKLLNTEAEEKLKGG